MIKADIVNKVHEKLGLPKKEAQKSVDIIINIIKETLKEGESVKITSFGTFNVRKKSERNGRNPQTGEKLKISARYVITFKPSNVLKKLIQ